MSVNIKDIAKLCGVGISTVSRVINNTGSVSEATRKKVLDAINKYNYIPNGNARSLKITTSKNIALFVKGITNPFFNKMIRVIEQEVTFRGYPLMIQNVEYADDELDEAIRETQDRNLCGVIIMGGSNAYKQEKLKQLSIPCVFVTISAGNDVDPDLYSSVIIDDEKESFRATEYLISMGHKRIGFIHFTPSNADTPNSLRFKGYCRALAEYNLPFDEGLVAKNYDLQGSGFIVGYRLMQQLYARNRDLSAVFAIADVLAIGAAKAVYSMGMSVPEDISIIGFDGIEISEYYQPSLDTVYQPATEMALTSVTLLFDMMQGGKTRHYVYDAILMKRGSCGNISK